MNSQKLIFLSRVHNKPSMLMLNKRIKNVPMKIYWNKFLAKLRGHFANLFTITNLTQHPVLLQNENDKDIWNMFCLKNLLVMPKIDQQKDNKSSLEKKLSEWNIILCHMHFLLTSTNIILPDLTNFCFYWKMISQTSYIKIQFN